MNDSSKVMKKLSKTMLGEIPAGAAVIASAIAPKIVKLGANHADNVAAEVQWEKEQPVPQSEATFGPIR